jgi:hypothetical protein
MNGIKTLKLRFKGVAPLVLHSARTVDPFDPIGRQMKSITSKPAKQKTDADQRLLANLEWLAGATTEPAEYRITIDGEDAIPEAGVRVVIPADYVEGVLRDGARKFSKGKAALAGLFVENSAPLLDANGKQFPTLDVLAKDPRFRLRKTVKVQSGRLMRTRPMFLNWQFFAEVCYLPEVINESSVIDAAEKAGMYVGIGDHKPRFGRFLVEKV